MRCITLNYYNTIVSICQVFLKNIFQVNKKSWWLAWHFEGRSVILGRNFLENGTFDAEMRKILSKHLQNIYKRCIIIIIKKNFSC